MTTIIEDYSGELLKKLAVRLFNKYNSTQGLEQLVWENCLINLIEQAISIDGWEVMTTIIEDYSGELLKKLAVSLSNKYNSTEGPEQLLWENCLIHLFEQAISKDSLEVMTTIIKNHKQSLTSNPRFDLSILRLFGEPALGYVSLIEMISHTDKEQMSIIDEYLVKLAKQTTSVDVLMKLFEVVNPTQELITALVNRVLIDDVYNPALISTILDLEYDFSKRMSVSLVNKCRTNNQIKTFLAHPTAISLAALRTVVKKPELMKEDLVTILLHKLTDQHVIKDIVDHRFFVDVADSLIEHPSVRLKLLEKLAVSLFNKYNSTEGPEQLVWENCLIHLFEQAISKNGRVHMTIIIEDNKKPSTSTPRFDLSILRLFGEPMLEHLSLINMIPHADGKELDLISGLEHQFTELEFNALVKKVDTVEQIDTLFEREEMTDDLADILFEQGQCSFKINDWPWLTEAQLLKTLDKTSDYDSLALAITHENLSHAARNTWLNAMISKQIKAEFALKQEGEPDFVEKIRVALSGLKLKSYKFSLEAINNEAYHMAAKASFTLYNTLDLEVERYLVEKDLPAFQARCKEHIEGAMTILMDHRGYKQALLDILNVICTGLTGGYFYRKDKNNWRFFKTDTESFKVVDKFVRELNKDDDASTDNDSVDEEDESTDPELG